MSRISLGPYHGGSVQPGRTCEVSHVVVVTLGDRRLFLFMRPLFLKITQALKIKMYPPNFEHGCLQRFGLFFVFSLAKT
jgi:hypothetical protein